MSTVEEQSLAHRRYCSRLVAAVRLGRKTGKGLYGYE